MKKTRKFVTVIMALVMVMTMMSPVTADAAVKPKLNKKKVTLTITDKKKNPTVNLKAKNATGKVKWSTSDKKVATVKNGKVTAKSAGKATITCKVNKKKLTCKVTVKDKRMNKNGTKGDLKVEIKHSVKMELPYLREMEFGDNHVIVTYNGKDVTKKANYELRADNGTQILVNDILTKPRTLGVDLTGNYVLTVKYQGMENSVKVRIDTDERNYYECYCGAQFIDSKLYIEHDKKSLIDACNNGTLDSVKCGGFYIVPYYITKVTVVQ